MLLTCHLKRKIKEIFFSKKYVMGHDAHLKITPQQRMTYSAAACSSCRHFYSVDHCNLVFNLYIVSRMFLHLFELIYAWHTHAHQ